MAAIRASMFKEQLELHDDPARFKCCPSGRRAGKSDGIPKSTVLDTLNAGDGEDILICAETKQKAKALHWAKLNALVVKYKLPFTPNATEATWSTPWGATIRFCGLSDNGDADLLRGFKIRAIRCDETKTYERQLPYLVNEVLEAALGDVRGTLTLYGTPSETRSGPWFNIADPEGEDAALWSRHHWDVRSNPHFWKHEGGGAAWLAEILKRHGWDWGNATFQREYLGLFVNDATWLVVDFDRARNVIAKMPEPYASSWRVDTIRPEPDDPPYSWRRKLDGRNVLRYVGDWPHAIGCDYGYNDAFSIVPLTADPYSPDRFIPWAWKRSHLTYDDAADVLALMIWILQAHNVVCDPGGGGKAFYESFNTRYGAQVGANVRSAIKVAGSVIESIRFQNTELRTGRLKVVSTREPLPASAASGPKVAVLEDVLSCFDASALTDEWAVLRWKDAQKTEIVEGPMYPMDCFDGARYALLETLPWVPKQPPKQETAGERIERQIWEQYQDRAARQSNPMSELMERW
jgi:hypothetical protein